MSRVSRRPQDTAGIHVVYDERIADTAACHLDDFSRRHCGLHLLLALLVRLVSVIVFTCDRIVLRPTDQPASQCPDPLRR